MDNLGRTDKGEEAAAVVTTGQFLRTYFLPGIDNLFPFISSLVYCLECRAWGLQRDHHGDVEKVLVTQ